MARLTRYVNTLSSVGGDGTTNEITGVNRAYPNLGEWANSEKRDLVATNDIAEVVCSGGSDTSTVSIDGWVTSSTNYILIHAIDDKHNGVFDSNKYHFEGDSVATRFNIAQGYVMIEDLQFTRPTPVSSSATRSIIAWTSSTGTQYVRRNIFKFDSNNITGQTGAFQLNSSTPDYFITDNIFDNRLLSGGLNTVCITGVGSSADAVIYNNTFINWNTAIDSKSRYVVKNNIFQNCTVDISGTINSSNNYNLTDNATIAGTVSISGSTLIFTDKVNYNFSLSVSDTDASGSGISNNLDSNVSSMDVVQQDRGEDSADIGAFNSTNNTLSGVSGDANFDMPPTDILSSGEPATPQPVGDTSFNIGGLSFSGGAQSTLPQPVGNIDFYSNPVDFVSSGNATIPSPDGSVAFDMLSLEVTGHAESSAPYPVGNIEINTQSVQFIGSGDVTQPSPSGNIGFSISSLDLLSSGSTTLPDSVANSSLDVSAVDFSSTGSSTFPTLISNTEFDMGDIRFQSSGLSTQPQPSGEQAFDIESVYFEVSGSVTGFLLPCGSTITLQSASNTISLIKTSNLIALPKTSNLIKL